MGLWGIQLWYTIFDVCTPRGPHLMFLRPTALAFSVDTDHIYAATESLGFWSFLLAPRINIGHVGIFFMYQIVSGWWFGRFSIFPYIGNVIIPADELIFFRGVAQPPTGLILDILSYTVTNLDLCSPLGMILRDSMGHQFP